MFNISLKVKNNLDKYFLPASIWNREYRRLVSEFGEAKKVSIVVNRLNGICTCKTIEILPYDGVNKVITLKYVERLVKAMLWICGGWKLEIFGCDELANDLEKIYSKDGVRSFDIKLMGQKIYDKDFCVKTLQEEKDSSELKSKLGGNFDGCRIGFDLGGSDRKCAALIDGKVVHLEEVKWNPYFEKDPQFHIDGIRDSIMRAARKLPRIDAIGGSAAGIYVDNRVRVASLFRGVSEKDFDNRIKNIFYDLKEEFSGIPFIVANDGDVTALAGSYIFGRNGMLGISMGTSQAGGYVTKSGAILDWLNELAFVPIDYSDIAPMDEWSGDIGCGVQYFSQQCLPRLMKNAGIDFDSKTPLPELLEYLQDLMLKGDSKSEKIYESIGIYLGYAIPHYAEFYELESVLLLGRLSSGIGIDIITNNAKKVLDLEFPHLKKDIEIILPDEKFKRLGQAVVAASLPKLQK